MKLSSVSLVICWSQALTLSTAFLAPQPLSRSFVRNNMSDGNWGSDMANGAGEGAIERLEFKIFPDGRVEEVVRGIKGNNCNKVTETINEMLGKVVATTPTEEMFEQALIEDQNLYNTDSSSTSSW
ncbi:hypothetical protein MPSEU_000705000 [Mayamaea pseudoterrestris]|nr:hypothetical protein MPSEU_000705000 [Mayamaea pseudoterrestris]